ncbi:MAG TPA: YfhO family protein [Patescibacteria group bacterium]|nr:YfhO family protein [Patescibacteria group bacterium]
MKNANSFLLAKTIKSFWAIGIIFLLWVLFSYPFFFQGKIPFAGDYNVTFFPPWSQYSQFNQPVKNNAMPDVIDQLYPWKHLIISDWKSGEIPLWNPYQFAGTPFLANYQSAAFSPMNLLFFIFPFVISWGLLILLQPLLAGLGMYFFVRKLQISPAGSVVSSVAFMFCSFLTTWMGYGTLGYAIGVLPLVLLGLEGYVLSQRFRYLLLVVFGLTFSFLSGHFQISLYVFFAGFLYFLFRYVPLRKKKIILFGLVALVIGVLLASVQIFPSIAFYAVSLRSTIFQRPEVIPLQYLFIVVAPDFFGNPVTRNDWFGHYAEWGCYIGVLPFLFAVFSLLELKKNKFVVFFVGLSLLSLFLATPTFLGDLIVQFRVPVLATSAAGRIIVLFSFSLAVLSGFGFDSWINASKKKKLFLDFFSILFLIVGWTIVLVHLGMSLDHVRIAKQNFMLPSILLIGAIIGTTVVFLTKNKKVVSLVIVLFLALTFFDMYRFGSKWQSFSPQNLVFPEIGITKFFQTIKNSRTLGNYGGQVSLYYQLPSLEGYDALYPERFGEFASFVADGTIRPAARSVVDFPKNGKYTKDALNLLGVTYIVHKISDTNKPWTFPVWVYPNDFSIAYQDGSYIVFKNKMAYPRAFIVGDYVVKAHGKDELDTLFGQSIDRKKTILLEEDPVIAKTNSLSATATINSYTANAVIITTTSSAKALLFLSDTYFPGWRAYVDGKETKIYRADYASRAIAIPSGKHVVVFRYFPDSFVYGIWGTVIGLSLIGGLYFFQKKSV